MPKVSVLMAVHNGLPLIREAVSSILDQSFTDFEFIVVDDGSADGTFLWLDELSDKRIKLLKNRQQLGLSHSLNKGMRIARGKYIARMDYDDLSAKNRLELQVKYLDKHPDIDILGTWALTIGRYPEQVWKYPVNDSDIKAELLFSPVLVHGSVMLRLNSFRRAGLEYDHKLRRAQDYDLWERASEKLRFANLDRVLVRYRVHSGQVGQRHGKDQQKVASKIRLRILRKIGITANPLEQALHNSISQWSFSPSRGGLQGLNYWFSRITEANNQTKIYQKSSLDRALERRWWVACRGSLQVLGYQAWVIYRKSPISKHNQRSVLDKSTFWLKSALAGFR